MTAHAVETALAAAFDVLPGRSRISIYGSVTVYLSSAPPGQAAIQRRCSRLGYDLLAYGWDQEGYFITVTQEEKENIE